VIDQLQPVEREVASRDKRWYIARLRPYRTAEDLIDGVVVTFTDITARRRAEDLLRASEQQFRKAVEDAPIPIIMCAEDGRVLQISQTWTELTGDRPEDVPTVEAWLSRTSGDGANVLRRQMQEIFKGERVRLEVELLMHTRDGRERHWSFSASAPGTVHEGKRYIVGMALDITERRRVEEERREAARVQLLQRLAAAQEAERRRIARELHDEMGQSLTGLILGLRELDGASLEAKRAERLRQLQSLANDLSRQIHELALELRPTALDDAGLGEALRNYLDAWSERSGIAVAYHDGTSQRRLPSDIETALYRAVQESLNNVWKHSHAGKVSVVLEFRGSEITAIVEDNGTGFEVDDVLAQLTASGRLGLLGMQERLAAVGGKLDIESTPGGGSTVFARVPLPRPRAAETP